MGTLEESLGVQGILWDSLGHFGTPGESFGIPKVNMRTPKNSLGLARTPGDSGSPWDFWGLLGTSRDS